VLQVQTQIGYLFIRVVVDFLSPDLLAQQGWNQTLLVSCAFFAFPSLHLNMSLIIKALNRISMFSFILANAIK
jgi:hypothetical protein